MQLTTRNRTRRPCPLLQGPRTTSTTYAAYALAGLLHYTPTITRVRQQHSPRQSSPF